MPVVCVSCDSKIITRAQIGHKEMQKHSSCPTCGVVITFIMDLDQKNVGYRFRDPENGRWADDEEGAIKTLTFSDELATDGREVTHADQSGVSVNTLHWEGDTLVYTGRGGYTVTFRYELVDDGRRLQLVEQL